MPKFANTRWGVGKNKKKVKKNLKIFKKSVDKGCFYMLTLARRLIKVTQTVMAITKTRTMTTA